MIIFSNPDQSKHLETARMRLFDVWIDFVNLRSEDYSENSRIPTMVIDSMILFMYLLNLIGSHGSGMSCSCLGSIAVEQCSTCI